MSRSDVREYLTKIYQLPVREVRIGVQMGTKIRENYSNAEKRSFPFQEN